EHRLVVRHHGTLFEILVARHLGGAAWPPGARPPCREDGEEIECRPSPGGVIHPRGTERPAVGDAFFAPLKNTGAEEGDDRGSDRAMCL
ncbi:hypothetical protein ACFYUK_48280, partial [Nonomuraea wenchangensis]